MTDGTKPRYATAAAFRQALTRALKTQAQLSGRLFAELEREFLLQRFLARVFHQDATQWVLKGGIGLLIRLPKARFSRDLDLFNRETGVEDAKPTFGGAPPSQGSTPSPSSCHYRDR